jgi:outer membrane protein OmpA-like peptidoglycan-associated protein
MRFCPIGTTLQSRHVGSITPKLINANDTVSFPTIYIYGKDAYYHAVRNGRITENTLGLQYRDKEVMGFTPYRQTTRWQPWMNRATLMMVVTQLNDCGITINHEDRMLISPKEVYRHRQKAGKHIERTEHLQGSAYIAFLNNKTDILPEYRNNQRELKNLQHTIDSIAGVSNISIRRIDIKGFASPEGTFVNNSRLAKGRTESLRHFIVTQWGVDSTLVSTSYEPEDWVGFRRLVQQAEWPERQAVLDIIDSGKEPDEKLTLIRKKYPALYKQMSNDIFPLLRHTDYRIEYSQKNVTDLAGSWETDTLLQLPVTEIQAALPDTKRRIRSYKPLVAIKTNLLYDLAIAPNISVELPLGQRGRWSVLAEYVNPWWRWSKLDFSYQIQAGVLELRRWFTPRCDDGRAWLTGQYVGLYGGFAQYDIENKGVGDQGDIFSAGLSYGWSWPIGRHFNFELGLSAGVAFGERRHYNAEFESTHLIYKYTKKLFYAGPTNLRVTLVYLLPSKKKGGDR